MRRRTLWLLIAGCAVVLLLDAPYTIADIARSWRGTERQSDTSARRNGRAHSGIELASRPINGAG
jgi:hypothetical protein